MSDEQRAPDPEEQKRMANAGDDVQAHKKGHIGKADEGGDDDDAVEAHHKGHIGRADEGNDDEGDDVEAHFKGHTA